MPLLLYRYMLGDLLRVFALTAGVLVVIIAFGATIRPLAGDSLMGAGDAVKYMALAIVPMLQFALPFAAGFASTMVLHRMTSENEIVAAAANGISYGRLLAPLAAMGVVLTLVMAVLMNWTIPKFFGAMERLVVADVTRLFESSIRSGSAFQIGDLQIHADSMRIVSNPSDTEADVRFILSRVTAADIDVAGRIEKDVTARQAVADIYRRGDQTFIQLVLVDVVGYDTGSGQLARGEKIEPRQAIQMSGILRDELRTKSRGELLHLRDHPDEHGDVIKGKEAIARSLDHEQVARRLSERLDARGEIVIEQAAPSRRRYVIQADRMHDTRLVRDGAPVEMVQFEGQTAMRRITAGRATLMRSAGVGPEARFTLDLAECEVTDLQAGGVVNRRERLADHHLVIPGLDLVDLSVLSSDDLIALARERGGAAAVREAAELEHRIVELHWEIRARLMKRHAQSITALLLLVLGAALAMLLRGSLPLVVYIWAFAPSVITLILAAGGDKMMRDGELYWGATVMWSGNAAMALMLAITFLRLRRN